MKKYFNVLTLFLTLGLMMQSCKNEMKIPIPAAEYEDYVFIDLEE